MNTKESFNGLDFLDAERYRWIRGKGCPFAETDPAWDDGERLDREIDACIAYEARQQTDNKS